MLCGGVGEDKAATPEVQAICEQVRGDIEQKLKEGGHHEGALQEFRAIKHKTQVVAGTNFFVKLSLGDGKVVHARIFRDLQQQVSLHSIQHGKTQEDPIDYF